jgi:putative transposase
LASSRSNWSGSKKDLGLPIEEKRRCIALHPHLRLARQCELLGLPRSTFYHQPAGESRENLDLMRRLDELYLELPYFGSRKFAVLLGRERPQPISRKRVQRLMRLMGIEALYPKPNLSRPAAGHEIYPYLLRNVIVSRPTQVWSTDITYIPMRSGFLYLVVIIDWFSRFVLSWDLSNTMEVDFCRSALEEALCTGRCEIFNSDQGCAIYLPPVSATAQGPLYPDQHGWTRASHGQCVYRAVVALGEIRTDLPRRLRFRRRTLVSVISLFRPLQFPPPASGVALSNPSRTVPEPITQKQNKVSRYAAVFAFTAHGLARELHQNNALKPKALQSSRGLINSRLLRSQSVASAMGTYRARPRCAASV